LEAEVRETKHTMIATGFWTLKSFEPRVCFRVSGTQHTSSCVASLCLSKSWAWFSSFGRILLNGLRQVKKEIFTNQSYSDLLLSEFTATLVCIICQVLIFSQCFFSVMLTNLEPIPKCQPSSTKHSIPTILRATSSCKRPQ